MNLREKKRVESKDLLNPNSTLTPGVAGAMTMMISNTLASQFDVLAKIGLLVIIRAPPNLRVQPTRSAGG